MLTRLMTASALAGGLLMVMLQAPAQALPAAKTDAVNSSAVTLVGHRGGGGGGGGFRMGGGGGGGRLRHARRWRPRIHGEVAAVVHAFAIRGNVPDSRAVAWAAHRASLIAATAVRKRGRAKVRGRLQASWQAPRQVPRLCLLWRALRVLWL